jgi:HAMP domain-containing protein
MLRRGSPLRDSHVAKRARWVQRGLETEFQGAALEIIHRASDRFIIAIGIQVDVGRFQRPAVPMKAIRDRSIPNQPAETRPGWKRVLATGSSLPCKLIVFVVVLVLATTGTVAGYLLRSSVSFAREHEHTQVSEVGRAVARAASHAFREQDFASLQDLARRSATGQPLVYTIVYDRGFREIAAADFAGGRLIEELRRQPGLDDIPRGMPLPRRLSDGREVLLDVMYPVTSKAGFDKAPRDPAPEGLLGYIRVGMIAGRWYRALDSRVDILVGVGILVAVTAIPLGYLLVRRVVMPLESLNKAMIQFSQGHWEVRSPVVRNDEIGRLTRTFNRMADLHQEMHERIVKLNNQLEERVAMRTRQLRELASREPYRTLQPASSQ